jgi:PIN domain nuclease of toxin-antitoxin system
LNPQLLLDTHIAVRWLDVPDRLSREQRLAVEDALNSGECLGVSAYSLLEIVLLWERKRIGVGVDDLLNALETHPAFQILPLSTDVAREVAAMGDALRDPGDRVIVATARVHRLRLLTADQRIIESNLVSVIE